MQSLQFQYRKQTATSTLNDSSGKSETVSTTVDVKWNHRILLQIDKKEKVVTMVDVNISDTRLGTSELKRR